MAERERKTWRELCRAALEAKDPNELLKIVEELSKVLKHEEQIRRDFREATRASKSYADTNMSRISRYSRLGDGRQSVSMSHPCQRTPTSSTFNTIA